MEHVLIDVAGTVLQAVLLGLVAVAIAWLKSKVKSERLLNALTELEKAAEITVGELQQTVVFGLKEAAADGKLSKEEIAELGQMSLSLVKARMSGAAQNLITAAGMDLNDLIRAQVEKQVLALKG